MKDFVNVTDVSFNEVNLEKVGKRIKKLRIENHLTVEQFAEILCVSENAVYKWQRGDSAPDIMNFGFMSSRFEVSLDYLILGRGDGDEPSPLPIYWKRFQKESNKYNTGFASHVGKNVHWTFFTFACHDAPSEHHVMLGSLLVRTPPTPKKKDP